MNAEELSSALRRRFPQAAPDLEKDLADCEAAATNDKLHSRKARSPWCRRSTGTVSCSSPWRCAGPVTTVRTQPCAEKLDSRDDKINMTNKTNEAESKEIGMTEETNQEQNAHHRRTQHCRVQRNNCSPHREQSLDASSLGRVR